MRAATGVFRLPAMMPQETPRYAILSFMVGLCANAKEMRAAEGYLLELLAWCAFGSAMERNLATA